MYKPIRPELRAIHLFSYSNKKSGRIFLPLYTAKNLFGRFFSSRFGCFFSGSLFSGYFRGRGFFSRLFFGFGFFRNFGVHGNLLFASADPFKGHNAADAGEEAVITAAGYVGTGQEFGTALAYNDFPSIYKLGTVTFNT